ncbi:MAG: sigma-54-dependent Fis family transcriptional regulator [Deltaproteobacteria bacterium]|nr:sigma-54-dependent Fis family transcriptional regulator [Deltaproteobacteria bacterium]
MEFEDDSGNRIRSSSGRDSLAPDSGSLDIESFGAGAEEISGMVVQSAEMRKVLKTIARLGPYKATVLIYGESGTGKELVARALHVLGSVPKGPFITFNCSNLVESLAESQLFGHVRGAFTDAREDSLGYFRSASGGILFLDEIGELPLRLQPKLLRAVEMHEVQPVGSAQSYKVDLRLIAATNRDLRTMVKAGQFRDDLYYRLSATAIMIPPLRQRRDGIGALTLHFIKHYNRLFGKNIRFISRQAFSVLMVYDWPGNVREFSHAIQSAVMLTDSEVLEIVALPEHISHTVIGTDLPVDLPAAAPPQATAPAPIPASEPQSPLLLDEVIKKTLMRSLEETEGNRRRAADLLGVSRSTLYRMLARYKLGDAETGRRRTSEGGPGFSRRI